MNCDYLASFIPKHGLAIHKLDLLDLCVTGLSVGAPNTQLVGGALRCCLVHLTPEESLAIRELDLLLCLLLNVPLAHVLRLRMFLAPAGLHRNQRLAIFRHVAGIAELGVPVVARNGVGSLPVATFRRLRSLVAHMLENLDVCQPWAHGVGRGGVGWGGP